MTTLLAVGLIQLASTTVDAADITSEYTYKKYITVSDSYYIVLLSDTAINAQNITSSFGSGKIDPNTGISIDLPSPAWVAALDNYKIPNAIVLIYTGATWETRLPIPAINNVGAGYVFLYEQIGTASNSKPSKMPAIDLGLTKADVQSLIDTKINATTSVTTSAKNIQTQATNAYVDYSNGSITLAELQATIDSLATQLQSLNNSSSATLADKIAVNNAITQTQLVQDAANKDAIIAEMEEDLTVSSSVSATITGKINQANQIFNQYSQGDTTQTEAVTQINQYITQLTQLITPQTPTADINAINSAINTINGIKDSVTTHSELSPDVSEEQVQSDQEEIEMLNEMMSVMQEQVVENKMEDQRVAGQAGDINSILEPIWNNKYMTYLVGVSGVLILACIVLHTKYRML